MGGLEYDTEKVRGTEKPWLGGSSHDGRKRLVTMVIVSPLKVGSQIIDE